MARRGKRRGGGGGFGRATRGILPISGMIGAGLLGMGAAATTKRFVGAPAGTLTGALVGFLVGGLGGAVGGWVHDNLGNIGAQSAGGNGSLAG